jgi:hypothetical protein
VVLAGSMPSCQESLAPQQRTDPSTIAQVVSPPAASATAGQQLCPFRQRKKPGLQVKPQLLDSHLLVECCGVAQTFPQTPQLFGSLSIDAQVAPPQSTFGAVQASGPGGCKSTAA